MNELSLYIDSDNNVPIYEQIYEGIKNEIRSGKLAAGTKLPSSRVLSVNLGVSRSTVQMSYDQLISEGYIEAQACRGYFVLKIDGLYHIKENSEGYKTLKKESKEKYDIDFSPSGIELDNFPFNAWRKVSKNMYSLDDTDLFNIGDAKGDEDFRNTIADYLHQSRGVNCSADNIILGAGNEYLLMLLDQIFSLKSNRHFIYAMENPAYRKAYMVFKGMGRKVCPIGLDDSGMKLEELFASSADVAYVTPSHQYPMGIVMSIGRRMELLKWAEENDERYIIEDDYDSEFRYKGKPIPSLQGLDAKAKVIYLGTFSKSIAPGIRMSYIVLPPALMEYYYMVASAYSSTVSRLDQNMVNLFIKEGYYERHLNKMRAIYKAKHDILMSEIKKLGKEFKISGESAGLHILVSTNCLSEKELVERASECKVRVYPLSRQYLKDEIPNGKATVILGYARLKSEQIKEGIDRLSKAWRK